MVKNQQARKHYGRLALICLCFASLIALAKIACPDALDVMLVTAAAADLYTTDRALRVSPSLHEANPLMQTPGARVGVKTLATVGVIGGARYLERRGHSRAAKILKVAAIVAWSGAAVNNVLQTRGLK